MTAAWTMTEVQTYEDHEVLESEYCSGYIDGSGKWNSGFYCSSANADGPLHCCGTATHKYCCMQKEAFSDQSNFDADLALVFGIILGITAAVTIVMLASCCFCSCCLLYKKRQSNLNDVFIN
ncbi:hypothetical protein J437_LFUL007002 [Ladona fulva]|uniref:Shisa N-terminal domain-containing protein n=1 Tax=Ladona fulva TaxID=123851 RepID=A0A8K0NX36_LADFU|nr:hypothetical protein J437_LFUL007002 [Ladona fulva]